VVVVDVVIKEGCRRRYWPIMIGVVVVVVGGGWYGDDETVYGVEVSSGY